MGQIEEDMRNALIKIDNDKSNKKDKKDIYIKNLEKTIQY